MGALWGGSVWVVDMKGLFETEFRRAGSVGGAALSALDRPLVWRREEGPWRLGAFAHAQGFEAHLPAADLIDEVLPAIADSPVFAQDAQGLTVGIDAEQAAGEHRRDVAGALAGRFGFELWKAEQRATVRRASVDQAGALVGPALAQNLDVSAPPGGRQFDDAAALGIRGCLRAVFRRPLQAPSSLFFLGGIIIFNNTCPRYNT